MTIFESYLLTILSDAKSSCLISGVLFGIITLATFVCWAESCFDRSVKKIAFIIFSSIFMMSLLGFTLIPSTKQAIVIYTLPKLINNEQLNVTVNGIDLMKLTTEWLKEQTDENKNKQQGIENE